MNDLIPLINKLQDILAAVGNSPIDLPQIAVVGSQSSGKSSVLEAIVGKDFLPKGSGIVTRRPLVLQLRHSPVPPLEGSGEPEEWAEFLHKPDTRFTNFEDVKSEIEAETARIAGVNKGISSDPIHLKVFSPHVVDLTLVDLPGLTKIPVGDQPGDIELQIRELIMGYVLRPNCIVLAVSPANVDLANSDSLKLAREVDPQGSRTLGLLTKLDLMDSGTSAMEILAGRVYPLRLGFVGVVNRSQRDIEMRRSLEYARKRESQFFAAHPVYASIPNKVGTENLARTLNTVLLTHIRERLPELKIRLNALISAKQQELSSYGDGPGDLQGQSPQSLVLRLITKYAADFNSSVEGTNSASATTELSGGARLFHIFDQVFGHSLEALDPVASLSVREIRTAMRNATGSRPALFIPEAAFDLLVKPQIARLETPSLRCVDTVYEELLRLTHESCFPELRRYPVLRARVLQGVADLLKEHLVPTRTFVATLVAIQRAYINTSHPDFIGGANAVAQLEKKYERERRKKESADRMRRLTHQYSGATATGGAGSAQPGSDVSAAFGSLSLRGGGTNNGNGVLSSSSTGLGGSAPPSSSALASSSSSATGRDSMFGFLFGSQHRPPSVYGPTGPGGLAALTTPGAAAAAQQQQQSSYASMSAGSRDPLHLDDESDGRAGHQGNGPSFAGSTTGSVAGDANAAAPREREDFAIALIRSLIHSYFGIVKKALADAVPKAVMHLLVNATKEALQNRLVQALYRDEVFDEVLQEDPAISKARKECKELLEVYQSALEVIAQAF
ncbi:Dynamin central region-domain-containing protein [Blastocladiella britannica]|nr:Dynamin central region-domain-containing protein [Blastocladiella britannica]